MEIVCHWTECSHAGKKKMLLLYGPNSTQETFHGLKQQNFSATDKKVRILC